MRNQSFVRTELLEEKTPPSLSIGLFGWLRANLFSRWYNTILTILSVALIFVILANALPWVFLSVWKATSLAECREIAFVFWQSTHGHACWAVINERWLQFMFGFYPSHLYWRPIVALLLLGVALAPILFEEYVPRKLLFFSAVYPFIMPWLIWGGSALALILIIAGFGVSVLVYRLMRDNFGFLSILFAVLIATLAWWFFAVGFISNGANKFLTGFRLEARLAHAEALLEASEPRLEAMRTEQKEATRAIRQLESTKGAAFGAFKQEIDKGGAPSEAKIDALRADFVEKVSAVYQAKRDQQELGQQVGRLGSQVRGAKILITRASAYDANKEKLAQLKGERLAKEKALRSAVSKDERNKLTAEIKEIKKDYELTKGQMEFVSKEVGSIGLEQVESRNFGGFMLSILIGVVAIGCSLPIGILLALGRQSDLYIIKYICVGFIEFFRGVPLITLLLIASTLLNIFLPPGTKFDIISRVMIMVAIFASAYIAEVIRGGLAALPKGQYEGADSLGLSYWHAQYLIIMPQALKISIPGIVSTFIGVFKDTTLVLIIGLLDPLGLGNTTRADTAWNGIYWEIFVFIAVPFFIICFSMSRYSMYLERKLKTDNH